MTQTSRYFEAQITQTFKLDYLVYLPPGYESDTSQRWPLIFFLHASGERGSDLSLVKGHGLPRNLEAGHDLPFIVVSPQCPADSYWTLHTQALNALLSEVIAHNRVDEDRIYLTGMSMGGAGAWLLAASYPERFAAVVPIASHSVPIPLPRLKNLPLWVFHGDADERAPVNEIRHMVDALKAIGANVKMTIYPGVGHDSWTQTYSNPALYDWFLSHKRA
jgi:predicted peptidase